MESMQAVVCASVSGQFRTILNKWSSLLYCLTHWNGFNGKKYRHHPQEYEGDRTMALNELNGGNSGVSIYIDNVNNGDESD